ncbi:TPA: hypothetical protein ACHGQU_000228 [Pseudomonas aeruginosa]
MQQNENFAKQAEQAETEAERPEVVGYLATAEHPKHGQPHKAFNYFKDQHDAQVAHWRERGCTVTEDRLMTVSQHDRIVGALRAKADQLREALEWRKENQAGQRELLRSVTAERDAALARVAELEGKLTDWVHEGFRLNKALAVAQAQHSGPGKYDEVLLPFLKSMEHELHANAGKGDRPGWLQMDRKTALLEIYYHLGKLQKATKGNDTAGIVEYAADVANMSMMLVDVCGLLAAAPGKEGV